MEPDVVPERVSGSPDKQEGRGRLPGNSRYSAPAAIAIGIAGLLLLPVLFPFAMMQLAWDNRKMREIARRTRCERCGELLDDRALEHAATLWHAHVDQLRRDHPHTIFRLVRPYDAVCVVCEQEYKWRDGDDGFEPVRRRV